ncbi:MAG: hypothetical protein EOO99_11985, partial [Pedobacter sp.]
MKVNVTKYRDDTESNINKKLVNIMLTQYKAGLAKREEEEEGNVNDTNDDTVLDTVTPRTTISIPGKGKKQMSSRYSRSYSAADSASRVKSVTPSGNKTFMDFMAQSKLLDNELDQMVSSFKYNNKGEFYSNTVKKKGDEGSAEELVGGVLMSKDDINTLLKEKTVEEIQHMIGSLGASYDYENEEGEGNRSIEEEINQLNLALQYYQDVKRYNDFRRDNMHDIKELLKNTKITSLRHIGFADAGETKKDFVKRFADDFRHLKFDPDDPDTSIQSMRDQEEHLYLIKDRLIHHHEAPEEPYVIPEYRDHSREYRQEYDAFQKEITNMVKMTSLPVLKKINLAEANETKKQFMTRFRQEYPHIPFDNTDPDRSLELMRNQMDSLTTLYNALVPYYHAATFS